MTKFLVVILMIFHVSPVISKGANWKPSSTVVKVAPSSTINEISKILDEVIDGKRQISQQGCTQITYFQTTAFMYAEVNGEKFYILIDEQNINNKIFTPSTCIRSAINDVVQIECVSRLKENPTDESSNLVFYIQYSNRNNTLDKCPQEGSIVQ